MRVVFMGSGGFAIPSLEALLGAGHDVAAVVTQPDRVKGRGRHVAPPPVKVVAERHGLELLQPRRIREPEVVAHLRALQPALQVVVAYGQILPGNVLEIPARGTVNVHASLLPRYRGAAPVQWAIVRGETITGVTTMLLDAGLDTGPILLARELAIGERETAGELESRLATLGASLLLETLRGLTTGSVRPRPQDEAAATLAPLLKKEDAVLDWNLEAIALARRIRGFEPWPGSTTRLGSVAVKVLAAVPVAGRATATPGSVEHVDAQGITVCCGNETRLLLIEVKPESRRAMPAAAFAAGWHVEPGSRFG